MDEEEQQRRDDEARAAALDAMARADETIADEMPEALSPVTGTPARRTVTLDEPMRVEASPDVARADASGRIEASELNTDDYTDPETGTASPIHPMEGEDYSGPLAGSGPRIEAQGAGERAPTPVTSDVSPPAGLASVLDVAGKPERDASRDVGDLPRLDDGLPTEDEIGRAHTLDDWRRPLFALGAALSAYGGHAPQPFERRADALEQQRRQGLRQALASKGAERRQERDAEQSARRQALQDSLAERRVAAAEAMVPGRVAQMQAQTERTQMSTEQLRAEVAYNAATREQREDPGSSVSDGMRRAVAARLAEMGPAGQRASQEIGDLDGLNANQLHDILPTLMQGVGIRTSSAGGGGSGLGSSRSSDRIAEAVRLGMFEDEATARRHLAAVGSENFDRELVSRLNETTMTEAQERTQAQREPLTEGQQGEEVFPGIHAGVRLGAGEGRAIRHDLGQVAARMTTLGRIRALGEAAGWSGAISPEVAARVRPMLMQLRSMAAAIQGTGVINPSEVEVINAALPDPTNLEGLTFGTLQASADSWQDLLEDTVRGNLGDTGIGVQEGADAVIGRLRAAMRHGRSGGGGTRPRDEEPSATPAAPASGDRIRVRAPDGRTGTWPASRPLPDGYERL